MGGQFRICTVKTILDTALTEAFGNTHPPKDDVVPAYGSNVAQLLEPQHQQVHGLGAQPSRLSHCQCGASVLHEGVVARV